MNVFPSQSANFTITVTKVNGFAGTVALSSTSTPSGLTCSLTPASIVGGSGTAFLSCSSSTANSYTVTVTGTSGSLTHNTIVTVNVQDFTITASPTSVPIAQGNSGSSTITISSLGGFSGTVNLAVAASPNLGASLSPTSVTGSGTSMLTITTTTSTPTGTYLVNVTGTSGSLSHSVTVTVTVSPATAIQAPFFTQMTWNHRFSLSKYNNVQTWRMGVKSNSTAASGTLYFAITVTVTDGSGTTPFAVTTQVYSLAPHQNINQINLSATFSPSQIGETWNFIAVIHWGTTATTDPSQLPFISTLTNGAPTSGSFTVLP